MLLVEPPLPREDWMAQCLGDLQFRRLLCRYAETYQSVVLALPADRMARILSHLVRGSEDRLANAASFHVVVERELRDHEAESSGKAARLIVLAALGRSLADRVPLRRKTRRMLRLCEAVVPLVLALAVNDHYACCGEEPPTGTWQPRRRAMVRNVAPRRDGRGDARGPDG